MRVRAKLRRRAASTNRHLCVFTNAFAGGEFLASSRRIIYGTDSRAHLTEYQRKYRSIIYKSVNYTYICTSTKYLQTEYLIT